MAPAVFNGVIVELLVFDSFLANISHKGAKISTFFLTDDDGCGIAFLIIR